MKVADSLYTSKIRYGIQLLGKVRTNAKDPINTQLKKIQVAQNKFEDSWLVSVYWTK